MYEAMNWLSNARDGKFRRAHSKEMIMRNSILVLAAIAGAIATPAGAQVIVEETIGGVVIEHRPALREYIVRERVPNYVIPGRVVVGSVLPETGITYYDVPQRFGIMPYRYTVVNDVPVLVEPRSRRIVEVIE